MTQLLHLELRPSHHSEYKKINDFYGLTYNDPDRAILAHNLRIDEDMLIEIVAYVDKRLVGAVCFARGEIRSEAVTPIALIGLVAVLPEYHGHSIGTKLIRSGLIQARKQNVQAVFTTGYPRFFQRFGFSYTMAEKIAFPWPEINMLGLLLSDQRHRLQGEAFFPRAFMNEVTSYNR